jgi:hypothetical protein
MLERLDYADVSDKLQVKQKESRSDRSACRTCEVHVSPPSLHCIQQHSTCVP